MKDEILDLTLRLMQKKRWHESLSSNSHSRIPGEYTFQDIVFNANSYPHSVDTAIIVTSWLGQLRWLKATLASYRMTGKFVILSYDNPFSAIDDACVRPELIFKYLPRAEHFLLAHSVVFHHKTYDADKRTAWFYDARYAQGILNLFPNIKYVYCTNGDCILEKPEGMNDLIKLLGNADFMSGQSCLGKTIHTCDVLYKKEAFNKIFDYMADRHRWPVIGSVSAEGLLREAVDTFHLVEKFAPLQPIDPATGDIDYYCTLKVPSTFLDIVGFRNLYSELEYAQNSGLMPIAKEFLDDFNDYAYMPDQDKATLCQYYKTGDMRYLYQWWDRGEDLWENRLFYPLEHYGKEPIYV